jgi:hypothetical protein
VSRRQVSFMFGHRRRLGMGTYFVDVIARDVPICDAFRMKQRVCSWLIAEGIILPQSTSCFLGCGGYGFPPGPRSGIDSRSRAEARRRECWCGLVIKVGRCRDTKLCTGPEEYRIECGWCGGTHTLVPVWEAFCAASRNWLGGRQPTSFSCPLCGQSEEVNDLRAYPAIGFGTLLLQWCEWPPEQSWVEQIGVLAGSRMHRSGWTL